MDTPYYRVEFDTAKGEGSVAGSASARPRVGGQRGAWPLNGWVHEAPIADADAGEPAAGLLGARRAAAGPGAGLATRLGRRAGGASPGARPPRLPPGRCSGDRAKDGAAGRRVSWCRRRCCPLMQSGWSARHAGTWDCRHTLKPPTSPSLSCCPSAVARVDVGGQAMRVDADQLPRACRDYYTAQGWVDLSNDEFGVTVACPDAPLVQLGDFIVRRQPGVGESAAGAPAGLGDQQLLGDQLSRPPTRANLGTLQAAAAQRVRSRSQRRTASGWKLPSRCSINLLASLLSGARCCPARERCCNCRHRRCWLYASGQRQAMCTCRCSTPRTARRTRRCGRVCSMSRARNGVTSLAIMQRGWRSWTARYG